MMLLLFCCYLLLGSMMVFGNKIFDFFLVGYASIIVGAELP
jgi:hypothetical protein